MPLNKGYLTAKQTPESDNCLTPYYAVDPLLEFLTDKSKIIWCPFDKPDSNFVTMLTDKGFEVTYGHIETGQDFFKYEAPPDNVQCVVSNPPFSKRNAIFKRLFEFNIPFALVMNLNGLFDSKERFEMFKHQDIELYIPKGRMKFVAKDKGQLNSPNFQSVYVCSKMLDNPITFADWEF